MREILFRGKDATGILNNSWFEGSLDITSNPTFPHLLCKDRFSNTMYVQVKQETVGQSTGLPDNSGKSIFEGDIVEFETNLNLESEKDIKSIWKDVEVRDNLYVVGKHFIRKDKGVVQWNEQTGMWELKVYNNGRYKRKSKLFTFRESGYVIIGNIHDNPKLLEG